MSFFGFDTTLPRDTTRGGARGGHSSSDGPFNPLGGDFDDGRELQDDELDAKIKGLTAGAQEDVEVSVPMAEERTRSSRVACLTSAFASFLSDAPRFTSGEEKDTMGSATCSTRQETI